MQLVGLAGHEDMATAEWSGAAGAGNLDNVARCWTAAQPTISAFISMMIPNYHDAQDILQDVAAAVFAHDFSASGMPRSFNAWAMQLARHKVVDYRRRRGTQKNMFDTDTINTIADAYANIKDEHNPRREALEHCLDKIRGNPRTMLELRYRANMRAAEISKVTGQNIAAVRVALHRIRLALRECIERRLENKGTTR